MALSAEGSGEDREEDMTYRGGLVQAGPAANARFGREGGVGVTTEAQLRQAHRTLESSLRFVSVCVFVGVCVLVCVCKRIALFQAASPL